METTKKNRWNSGDESFKLSPLSDEQRALIDRFLEVYPPDNHHALLRAWHRSSYYVLIYMGYDEDDIKGMVGIAVVRAALTFSLDKTNVKEDMIGPKVKVADKKHTVEIRAFLSYLKWKVLKEVRDSCTSRARGIANNISYRDNRWPKIFSIDSAGRFHTEGKNKSSLIKQKLTYEDRNNAPPDSKYEIELVVEERNLILLDELNELDGKYSRIIKMKYGIDCEPLPLREIAKIEGIAYSTLENRVRLGLRLLKARLDRRKEELL